MEPSVKAIEAAVLHVAIERVGAVDPVDSCRRETGGARLHAPVAQPEQW